MSETATSHNTRALGKRKEATPISTPVETLQNGDQVQRTRAKKAVSSGLAGGIGKRARRIQNSEIGKCTMCHLYVYPGGSG